MSRSKITRTPESELGTDFASGELIARNAGQETLRSTGELSRDVLSSETPAAKESGILARQRYMPTTIGRFLIQRIVGHGGMGMVFLAEDEALKRLVAIKIPRIELANDAKAQQRFLREGQVAARLRHPALVDVFEVGSDSSYNYMVSRWASGGSLYQWLAANTSPVPERRVLWLMEQVTSGLAYCHQQGISHLDLKPGNILFDEKESEEYHPFPGRPLISDFGMARIVDVQRTLRDSSSMFGTPYYMAPEQVECKVTTIGPRSDVFACGLLIMELLLGKHPLADYNLAEALQRIRTGAIPSFGKSIAVSAGLRTIVGRCLEVQPEHRYASALELHQDIAACLRGEPIKSVRVPWLSRLFLQASRPESIDQASYISIGVNLSIVVGFAITLATVALGLANAVVGSPGDLVVDITKMILFPHLPSLAIAALILRGRRMLHWLSTVTAAVFVFLVCASLASGVSPFRIYEGQPFALVALHIVILGLAAVNLAAQVFALPAWWCLLKKTAAVSSFAKS